ncbi:MAG TPA: PRC-barrel domain-containing protein [Candidatus Thermoplasmatota archaeon]|nr:PRC-barrel domain-containing protein [Candidatus Thermoplasmatota archaeon]
MDDEEEVDLREGMQVANEDGEALGTLAALLVEEEEDEAEFFLLKSDTGERLIPFDAVLGVGDGALVVDVTRAVLERYPLVQPGQEPSDEDVERAYDVYDETANYVTEEE